MPCTLECPTPPFLDTFLAKKKRSSNAKPTPQARPAVLMQYSTLDFLDVHVYPSQANAAAYLKVDMASEEWTVRFVVVTFFFANPS